MESLILILVSASSLTIGFILGAAFMLRKWEQSDATPRR